VWTSGQGNTLGHPTTDKNIEKVEPVKARWTAGGKSRKYQLKRIK
jgi:hypothetical protein